MKLSRYRSIPSLRKGIAQQSGRNANGKITVRHRGSGHKQAYRTIDWSRKSGAGVVVGFEYDPQRNTYLAKLLHKSTNNWITQQQDQIQTKQHYSYIVAAVGLKLFQELSSFDTTSNNSSSAATKQSNSNGSDVKEGPNKLLQPGDVAPLSYFEAGDFLHNVAAYPGQQPIFARSAGTFCQIRSLSQGVTSESLSTVSDSQTQASRRLSNQSKSISWAKVRLPSGSQRLINSNVRATFGIIATHTNNLSKHNYFNLRKAGRSRWLGWRPSVRGVARNPVDHPHGGGQGKTSGGRPSVTFKSWPTKGQPTRSTKRVNRLILTQRKH